VLCSPGDRWPTQYALEITGSVARRFAVYGAVIEGSTIASAELSEEPLEELELPLARDVAEAWL